MLQHTRTHITGDLGFLGAFPRRPGPSPCPSSASAPAPPPRAAAPAPPSAPLSAVRTAAGTAGLWPQPPAAGTPCQRHEPRTQKKAERKMLMENKTQRHTKKVTQFSGKKEHAGKRGKKENCQLKTKNQKKKTTTKEQMRKPPC